MTAQQEARYLPTIYTLWMERQFSGAAIARYMVASAAAVGYELRIISTPKQDMPDSYAVQAFPWLKDQAGIDQANKLIAELGVDALWVRSSGQYDLSGIDPRCKVHTAGAPSTLRLMDNKAALTESLGDDPVRADSTEAANPRAVMAAYRRLRKQGKQVCGKPSSGGVFGHGYWHLTEGEDSLIFSDPERRRMHPKVYIKGLKTEFARHNKGIRGWLRRVGYSLGWLRSRDLRRILIMEWLKGPEVSIDVLYWEGEPLLHAARVKESKDLQVITSDHPMIEHARMLGRKHKLHGIISVQYRCDANGNWKMLEVNPRPPGGCTNSENAGFHIIKFWTLLLLGVIRPSEVPQYQFHGTVHHRKHTEYAVHQI